ncbi:MAG: hypothetical protein KDC27_21290 [Acidobacteria bacterium]|nr:hypothetical protein [Acidobacteriota bacterium]
MRLIAKLSILTAALTIPSAAVDQNMLQMADPEINLLIGIRMGQIASSPLMLKVFDESKKSGPGFSELIDRMGPNPFASIDEVLIMGRVDADAKDAGADAVILAHGDFQGSAFQDAICAEGCKPGSHHGVALQLLEHDGKPAAFAKLSNAYAVMGAVDKVEALIDRKAAGGSPQFATRAQEWAKGLTGHDIWIAAQGPFEAPAGDGGPAMAQQMLDGLEGVGFGLTLGNDLVMSLDLRSKTEDDSKRLYTTLQGLLAMATMQQGEEGGPAELLEKLQMTQGARRITATLRAPADELQKTFSSGMSQSDPGGAEPTPDAAPAPAARKRSGKIRIYGLEEEPVVVDAGNH